MVAPAVEEAKLPVKVDAHANEPAVGAIVGASAWRVY
jgi:hypothetical protein